MSDLKIQVQGLYDDLKVAVGRDPKALAGIQTHTLLLELAHQVKDAAQNKNVVESVITALRTGPRGGFTVTDGLNLAGQLLRALARPSSDAKVFPDYIPKQIRDDYEQACLIQDLSAKASATLARRCLQGMIRDFWGVSRDHLIDEIKAIKDKVDAETWNAIDSVRSIGNIGAHMEKDVNLIINVDPEEARLLIWLIETLFKDWYVSKHEKEKNLKAISEVADAKKKAKTAPADGNEGTGRPLPSQ